MSPSFKPKTTLGKPENALEFKGLKDTPLAELVVLKGFIGSKTNLLFGFEEKLEDQTKDLVDLLAQMREEIKAFKTERGNLLNDLQSGFWSDEEVLEKEKEIREMDGMIKVEEEKLMAEKEVLVGIVFENCWPVFKFVLEHCRDEHLAKMGLSLTQKEIFFWLYALVDNLEDQNALGEVLKQSIEENALKFVDLVGKDLKENVKVPLEVSRRYSQNPAPKYSKTLIPDIYEVSNRDREESLATIPQESPKIFPQAVQNNDQHNNSTGPKTIRFGGILPKPVGTENLPPELMETAEIISTQEISGEELRAVLEQAEIEDKAIKPVLESAQRTTGLSQDLFASIGLENPDTTRNQQDKLADLSEMDDLEDGGVYEIEVGGRNAGLNSYERISIPPKPLKKPHIDDSSSLPTIIVDGGQELPKGNGKTTPPADQDERKSITAKIELVAAQMDKNMIIREVEPKKEEKTSLWSRFKNGVTDSVKSLTSSISSWFGTKKTEKVEAKATVSAAKVEANQKSQPSFWQKHARGISLAAGLSAVAAAGATLSGEVGKGKVLDQAAMSSNSAGMDAGLHAGDSEVTEKIDTADSPKAVAVPAEIKNDKPSDENKAPELKRNIAKILSESKSPLMQSLIKDGTLKLNNQNITDAMISPFKGLANDAQRVEITNLENLINLGLGVYFNEHFGTDAKVAAVMKGSDSKMKSLYWTAKAAKEKGWYMSYHTKDRFPVAYNLAQTILEDSAELGLDTSSHGVERVKGNMFQAKMPGDTLNLRKSNGQYHVINEILFKVFEGGKSGELVKKLHDDKNIGGAIIPTLKKAPDWKVTLPGDLINAPTEPSEGKTGFFRMGSEEKIKGFDLWKKPFEQKTEQDKVVQASTAKIDNSKNELDEIDAAWDLIEKENQRKHQALTVLEKEGVMEFELDLSLTSREEKTAVIPAVAEKMLALYGTKNGEKAAKLIKQFGYIGFKSVKRVEGGKFQVELHPNFRKILKSVV